jgi:hypothetical protein
MRGVDSIGVYIENLDWTSYEITTNYISNLVLKDKANYLIRTTSSNRNKQLLENIDSANKTVVIHVILTNILEPENAKFAQHYIYGNDSTVCGVEFTYNKLNWYQDDNYKQHIKKKEIKKIKKYWTDIIDNKE